MRKYFLLCIMVSVTLTACGVPATTNRLVRTLPQAAQINPTRQGTVLNLHTSVHDVKTTLEWAYADRERLMLAYRIQSPDGWVYEPHTERVTDTMGDSFQQIEGVGVSGTSEALGITLPPGESVYVRVYDLTQLRPLPPRIDVHMVLDVWSFQTPAAEIPVDPSAGSTTTPPGPQEPPQTDMAPSHLVQVPSAVGPFTFDFSLPVTP